MTRLNGKQIQIVAKDKLKASTDGLRWSNLVKNISEENIDTPENTIWGATQKLFKSDPEIIKISKGIYAIKSTILDIYPEDVHKVDPPVTSETGVTVKESEFYAPFAEWLESEDEVTVAIPVGGSILKGKWNTPDVIGVLRPLSGDLIKFSPQIISAEIKIDPNQPVTAFGQAVSYRLFSHKSYLVLPDSTSDDDQGRIAALCGVFGLGLVLFSLNPENPDFRMVTRAISANPDMIYVNQMAKRLHEVDSKAFDRLF